MKLRKMELLVLFLATALIAGTANADIDTGLVGYWSFNEGTGTTAYDASGNGWHGEFAGTPAWATGPEGFGGALYFDSRLKDPTSLDGIDCGLCDPTEGKGVCTMAMWAYWQGSPEYSHFMTAGGMSEMWQWELWANSSSEPHRDKVGLTSGATSSLPLSTDTMPVNEWVHLTITCDGSEAQLFINGIADPMGAQPFEMSDNLVSNFFIGRNTHASPTKWIRCWDGYLDEARVYSRVLSQSDIQELVSTDAAVNIAPSSGAVNVLVDTNLVWGPPPVFTPAKYDLSYKIGDPNFAIGDVTVVSDIAYADPCNVYNPPMDFAYETTYYWRIDSYYPGASDPCVGNTWSFTTVTAEPVVTKDPVSLTVAIGGTAVFTVEDVGGTGYVWKKQSDGLTVGTGPVLTLTDVQTDPCEDSYYCIVSNTSGSAPPSAAATLWTKRLIARWEFEDNLEDSEADGWNGDYTDPNTANDPPMPVFVLDPCSIDGGKALQLTADVFHVRITDSEDFFNFYPQGYTVNAWVKTVQNADYGCMASKQDRGDVWKGWVLNCTNTGVAAHGLRQLFGGSSVVGTSNIADNEWHMVTATYNAETGTGTVYVDGLLEGQLVDTVTKASTNAYPVVLGAETVFAELAVYEGLLDKVSIYSYALSQVDVAVLYTDVMTDESVCVEQVEYDFDGDCRVNLLDFALLATGWLECNLVPECLP